MPLRFPRLLGAHRDAVELQYVAALLQTTSDKSWRSDGTVTAIDVRRYLTSRHGFRVKPDILEREILQMLAGTRIVSNDTSNKPKKPKKKFNARKVRYHGGPMQHPQPYPTQNHYEEAQEGQEDGDDDNNSDTEREMKAENFDGFACMDICQLAAMIMIPELVQLARQHSEQQGDSKENNPLALMQLILDMLVEELAFVTPPDELEQIVEFSLLQKQDPTISEKNSHDIPKGSIRLTKKVLIRLFRAIGEDPSHWTSEDLDEMLQLAASGGNHHTTDDQELVVHLNAAALLKAVSSDVAIYPVEYTESLSTHYDDVMCTVHDRQPQQDGLDQAASKSNGEVAGNEQQRSTSIIEREQVGPSENDAERGTGLKRLPRIIDREVSTLKDILRPPLALGTSTNRIFTLASLDQAADTQKSLVWACMSWLALVTVAFSYFLGSYEDEFDYQTNLPSLDCSNPDGYSISEFGCKALNGVVLWLQVFFEISIVGGAFLVLSQLGNNVYSGDRSKWITIVYSLLGIGTVTFVCILSYFYKFDTPLFNTEGPREATHVATIFLGIVLVILQTMELSRLFIPFEAIPRRFHRYFVSGALLREQSTKHAAAFKTGRMLTDALGCILGDGFDQHDEVDDEDHLSLGHTLHSSQQSNDNEENEEVFRDVHAPLVQRLSSLVLAIDDRRRKDAERGIVKRSGGLQAGAFVYYHDHMDETAMTGSLGYFWANLFGSRSMIKDEGIWLSARLITANLAQWIVAILVVPSLFYAFYVINDEDDELEERQREEEIDESDIIPGIFVGGLGALVVTWLTALYYIPMAMSTVLQMRSGYLGNFFDQRFQLFRKSTDRATALFGSALWGSIFSAALAWGIIGGVIFVFLWNGIRDQALNFMAGVIGFTSTFILKWLMLKVFRRFYFSGLYRRKPGAANIFHLVLECWNIALSSGFMLLRVVRLVLTAVFYVGRMDTPFLAEGVGVIFNSPLDSYPMAFRRDLIVHDAHRHPWIERLGTIYMMKLQHGRQFGRRGGAAWRMVFVFALLPWLRKHRQIAPLYLAKSEDEEELLDGIEDDEFRLDSPIVRRASVAMMMQHRRASISLMQNRQRASTGNDDDWPHSGLLAENRSLIAENVALQRQVMELRSLLGRGRRQSTVQGPPFSSTSLRASAIQNGGMERPSSAPSLNPFSP